MPIKWRALPISEAMDKVEQQLNLAESFFQEGKRIVEEAQKEPNLPQYMDWDLKGLRDELGYAVKRCRNLVDRTRRDIPADALANEKKRKELGQKTLNIE